MYLIVGLGNPGKEYCRTRHNTGFMVATRIAENNGIELRKTGCHAIYGKGKIAGNDAIVALPQTYMNESGISVKELMSYFRISEKELIVIYDDMDIEVGSVRIRANGSAGSHNGMKSIIQHLSSENFARIRVGIGEPRYHNGRDFVLGDFRDNEIEDLNASLADAGDAVNIILTKSIEAAMNKYNKKKKHNAET